MKSFLLPLILLLAVSAQTVLAIQAPTGLVSRTGDKSIVLHWDPNSETNLAGYRVYRSITNGPFVLLNSSVLTSPGYCDLDLKVVNGKTNVYQVTAVTTSS